MPNIKNIIQSFYPEIIEAIKRLTAIDRGTKTITGLTTTAEYLSAWLISLGCDVTSHHDDIYGPTIVGRKKGKGRTNFLFYAHMDTVWPEGTCSKWPFSMDERFAYGPGVGDCTHGIISSLFLLKALNEISFDNYGEIIILFNPDEELTSPSSTQWIQHYAKQADVAFCMEGPDSVDEFVTSRAGSAYYHVMVKGKRAHCGVNPEEGADANIQLIRLLNQIADLKIPDAYFCLCWIKGGAGDCIVSDDAYAMLRFRILNPEKTSEITKLLEEISKISYVSGTETEIEYWPGGGFQPMPRLEWVDGLCELVQETSDELGMPLKEAYSGGGDDAASTATLVPTLDGLTPVSYGCHTREERLELSTIVPRITLLAVLVERICKNERYLRERKCL